MTKHLTDEELVGITHKKRPSAQVRALRAMGIQHIVRPDGTVLVLASHVEHLLNPGGRATVAPREPNWAALASPTTP